MSEQGSTARQPRPFWSTPAFWAGNILWIFVIVMAVVIWNQKPRRQANAVTPAGQTAEAPTTPEQAASNSITITTDKDGNSKVVMPGEKSGSPWDEDGIADFSLIDSDGKTVTKQDLLGKPWAVCFVFTHCAFTCPTITNSMRSLQDQLKDYEFHLVTLTVDPERDTPEILKEYGKGRGADFSKWKFLGGDQRDIYRLIHGSFKMPVQALKDGKPGFEFLHSNNIMLVDDKGVVRGKYDGTDGKQMAALRREIQKLAHRTGAEPAAPVDLPDSSR